MKRIIFIAFLFLSFSSWSQYDPSLYSKYHKALEKRKYKKAEKELIKISRIENDNFILLLTRGQYYSAIDELDSAALYLGNAIDYAKYSPISYSSTEFKQQRDSLYINAISTYDKIILKFPNAVNFRARGIYKMDIGLLRESLIDFSKSIQLDSTSFVTFYNQALAYRRLDLLDSALISYDQSIKLNSNYGSTYLNKGFVFIKMEEFENALVEFRKALEKQVSIKETSYTLNNIGYCYYGLKQFDLARDEVKKSININPINSYAYRNLALIEIAQNNTEAACEAIEKAIQLGFINLYGEEILNLKKENCGN